LSDFASIGTAGEWVKERKEKKFYPDYLAEIIVAILIALEILIILALLYYPSIGRQIDFTRPFQPKPEWYFLWLYQLVRYFPGKSAFIGTVAIPLISVFLLLSIPYIDRGRNGRLKAITAGSILLLMFLVLTLLSVI
jgi:quinol-cytochrome oxidoreductase complex cytochrome b subunit